MCGRLPTSCEYQNARSVFTDKDREDGKRACGLGFSDIIGASHDYSFEAMAISQNTFANSVGIT